VIEGAEIRVEVERSGRSHGEMWMGIGESRDACRPVGLAEKLEAELRVSGARSGSSERKTRGGVEGQ
jgi:hypothetical protein